MKQTSHNTGKLAENACCDYLQKQGLKLITRNYRGLRGEIDIVMQDKKVLVFVEVRYRKNNDFGGALESVTAKKQSRILATAEQYMQQESHLKNGRIDVVAMSHATKIKSETSDTSTNEYTFEWIRNAF